MNKQKYSHSGFGHIGVLVVIILVLGTVGFATFKVTSKSNKSDANTTNIPKQTTEISNSKTSEKDSLILQNLGIGSMQDVLVTKEALRDYDSQGLKGFYVFGDILGGKQQVRKNPNFEFASLKPGTKIIAAIDGVVGFIKQQSDSNDYEVFLQPKDGSVWTVGYDHLVNVAVKKGDIVKAGDLLGEPGKQGNGALRFEIQINKDANGSTTHYCPTQLLSNDAKSGIEEQLKTMMQSWNSIAGESLYSVENQSPAGCIVPTMTPADAEG